MKLAIKLSISQFEVRSTFEVIKKPLQKKKSPVKPKPQPSISLNNINILTHN